jgi:hypothetical protein
MAVKYISSALVLALATFGVPPCAGMELNGAMTAAADHRCCHREACPDRLDDSSGPGAMPQPDCCALGTLPDPQVPVQRTATSAASSFVSLDAASPLVWRAPLSKSALSIDDGPPPWFGVRRHLLLSVLLI